MALSLQIQFILVLALRPPDVHVMFVYFADILRRSLAVCFLLFGYICCCNDCAQYTVCKKCKVQETNQTCSICALENILFFLLHLGSHAADAKGPSSLPVRSLAWPDSSAHSSNLFHSQVWHWALRLCVHQGLMALRSQPKSQLWNHSSSLALQAWPEGLCQLYCSVSYHNTSHTHGDTLFGFCAPAHRPEEGKHMWKMCMRCSLQGTLSLEAYFMLWSKAQPNRHFYLGYGDYSAMVLWEPHFWGTQETLGPSLQTTFAASMHAQEMRGVCHSSMQP